MGVKYIKDRGGGRRVLRVRIARIWNLNVKDNKRSLLRYRKVDGIPGIYIRESHKMCGSETQSYCLED